MHICLNLYFRFYHFRTEVVGCTQQRLRVQSSVHHLGDSKVADFHVSLLIDEHICRFQIPNRD